MAKQAAFGTTFSVGIRQVETATAVGTVSQDGNMTVTTTAAGMAGSPLDTVVAVLNGDTPSAWAEKVRTALNLVAVITGRFIVGGSGPYISLTRLIAAADDNTLNIALADTTSAGITEDATSDASGSGVDYAAVAYVSNISGPGLAMDTVDVTSHDSTGAWEEVVASILRSGEVSLDLVYDPAADSQDATATTGLAYALKNKVLKFFKITFPDTTLWTFPGYVTGFEPGAPHDGALTASVKIKIHGAPTLA